MEQNPNTNRDPEFTDSKVIEPIQDITPREDRARNSFFTSPRFKMYAGGLLALLLILVLIGVASSKSLPGSPLYPIKINVVENVVGITKLSSSSKVAWNTRQIENRLDELLRLSRDTATTSPEVLSTLASGIGENAQTAITTIESSSLEETARIDALARLAVLTKSQETLVEITDEFNSISESIEDVSGTVDDSLDTTIDLFASTSPAESVMGYLADHMKIVSEMLPSTAPGSDAQRRAISRIEVANEAFASNDLARAITSILAAEKAIYVDDYIYDAERGPVEGAAPLPTVPQEG